MILGLLIVNFYDGIMLVWFYHHDDGIFANFIRVVFFINATSLAILMLLLKKKINNNRNKL